MPNTIDTAAIESLRTFAVSHCMGAHPHDHADRPQMAAFVHLCTAALNGEEWAMTRVRDAVRRCDYLHSTDATVRREICATDTTRPDGAVARSL